MADALSLVGKKVEEAKKKEQELHEQYRKKLQDAGYKMRDLESIATKLAKVRSEQADNM